MNTLARAIFIVGLIVIVALLHGCVSTGDNIGFCQEQAKGGQISVLNNVRCNNNGPDDMIVLKGYKDNNISVEKTQRGTLIIK